MNRSIPALISLCLALAACGESKPQAGPPPMGPLPVTLLEVQPQRIPATLEVMAQTEGAQESEVRARVGGILIKKLYREGEAVAAGQPLFQIDRAPFEIALADARARAEQALREMNRLKPLVEVRAVSQKEYDDAVSANAVAQAALRAAELNLSWTTVTAPVAGTTGRALKSEGSLVSVGADSLLTTIYQANPIWVRFSLGQGDLAKFPGGRLDAKALGGVELVLPDARVYGTRGKLNFVASNIDTQLGTQQLRAEFNNDGTLMPGQFVRVRLTTGERSGVFLVPQAAVMQTEQGAVVMLAVDGKASPRPVQTAEWRGKDWVVTGLAPGDKVIVDNLMKLRPGAPVAAKSATPPATPPAAPAAR